MYEALNELTDVLGKFEFVDLTHIIENDMPRCLNHPHVAITKTCTHAHDGFYNQCIVMGEHTGTHVDAPAHTVCNLQNRTIDTLSLTALCGQAVKYDLYKFNTAPGETVSASQILELEKEMGTSAQQGEIAILNFGWEKYWQVNSGWKEFVMNAPGLSEDAARLFMERRVKLIGCDTACCDMPVLNGVELKSYGHFEYWLPNNIYMIEMLKNLSMLPDRFYFITAPLRIKEGSGSPIRAVALVPKD